MKVLEVTKLLPIRFLVYFHRRNQFKFSQKCGEQLKSIVNVHYWNNHDHFMDIKASNPWKAVPGSASEEWQNIPLVLLCIFIKE